MKSHHGWNVYNKENITYLAEQKQEHDDGNWDERNNLELTTQQEEMKSKKQTRAM